ncbi:MAG TPA: hypothetical protein VNM70_03335, partial [Burkholderiales bacterium]|nr:hypothetical protein [Burkholderiales bacterium]
RSADRREGRQRQWELSRSGLILPFLLGIDSRRFGRLHKIAGNQAHYSPMSTRERRGQGSLKKAADCRNKMQLVAVFVGSRITEIKPALGQIGDKQPKYPMCFFGSRSTRAGDGSFAATQRKSVNAHRA